MKRREQRECIFQLLFRVEFNNREEMEEQAGLFVEDLKEENEVKEEDENYIFEKYKKVIEEIPKIDALLEETSKGWKTSRMGPF